MYTNGAIYLGAMFRKTNAFDTAEDLSAAAAVYGEMIVAKQCKVKRISFVVTTAIAASVTAPVVKFWRRPTIGSATNAVSLGTLTIPTGTAAGKVLYKDISEAGITLFPGEALAFEQTVQAVDGSAAAGGGYYAFELDEDPESPANQSNMIASA